MNRITYLEYLLIIRWRMMQAIRETGEYETWLPQLFRNEYIVNNPAYDVKNWRRTQQRIMHNRNVEAKL